MKTTILVIVLVLIGGLVWYTTARTGEAPRTTDPSTVLSFEDCVAAGYPVMESDPRQCRTPDGRTYAEEIAVQATYSNASANDIVVTMPAPGSVTGKQFRVAGRARGTWYFEGSFGVEVLDKNGTRIMQGPVEAEGEWMTTEFVPFEASITVPETYIGPATIVLGKTNAKDGSVESSVSIPIIIEY